MKALLDFLPIVLFFISYKWYGIYTAVYVMIIASVVQVLATRLLHKKFEKMQVIGLIAMVLFGSLTLWFRSPEFIMWKVSAINVIFGFILLGSLFVGQKPLIAYMLDKQIKTTRQVWVNLTLLWGVMFFIIALVNAYFVVIALNLRDKLITFDASFKEIDLPTIQCVNDLCTQAQLAESAWVNFKLFGSLGITLVFMVLTAIYIQKQIKKRP